MKSKLFLLIVPVLALTPVALAAQDGAGQSGVQAGAQAGVAAQAQVQGAAGTAGAQSSAGAAAAAQVQTPGTRIDMALQSAAEAGVPVSLLASKVAEGEAKGVPPERIAAAVEARLGGLLRASQTLSRADIETQSAGELSVALDALEAGVSEGSIIQVSRNAPPERRVVAIAVLADLVRLGHDSDSSAARVNAALGTNAALANLSAEVSADAALVNLQAEVATELQVEGLNSILENLGPEAGVSGGLTGTLGVID